MNAFEKELLQDLFEAYIPNDLPLTADNCKAILGSSNSQIAKTVDYLEGKPERDPHYRACSPLALAAMGVLWRQANWEAIIAEFIRYRSGEVDDPE
ncbi:hypothetical protein 2AV2_128 [Nodularia phage vB_NpeS-2AV2]|jgi:hypothetical protein|uniref:Uncharacterized protein n=3 Tax=Ravarandavirus TaxID=2843444 RepID=A0A482MIZ7_9CAUD|nr:hypothetical protein HWA92_gp128 [Nodularia phage vB_NpeS-2AV2]YP_009844950.1 hypothetical protein HWC13_gp170 [Nodularia phage vB_NspS-kac68v161]ALY07580.1 hypothetical protein 2AV2_128 [Nodularia phage vB_NpeS-2AV2]QBQ73791.1 hypothetical protein kac68v161_gp141 [Nodularia phage vB_NspS-kac68v161]QBQ73987.1 hypothetical protein kac68v162_gp139 [Nodularia phage vB_NspS-kac68v162]